LAEYFSEDVSTGDFKSSKFGDSSTAESCETDVLHRQSIVSEISLARNDGFFFSASEEASVVSLS